VKIKHSLLALALPLALLAGCDKAAKIGVETKPPVPVSVYQVPKQFQAPTITVTGEALNASVAIHAKATAIVKHVFFTPGQAVKTGDVLIEFDEIPLRAALAISDFKVKLTRIDYKEALRESSRVHALMAKGSATSLENDQALAAVVTSKDQYQAALASRRGDLFAVHQSKVIAPIDGILGLSTVGVGDRVTAEAETLAVITRHDKQWVEFPLTLGQYDALQLNKKAVGELQVTFTDGAVASLGAVEPLQPVDRLQSTLVVRARLLAPSTSFIPGDDVQVEMKATAPRLAGIPRALLRENSDGYYVFVVTNGKVDVRQVTAIHWTDSVWLVSQGLAPDDQIITTNLAKIRVGAKVEVAPVLEAAAKGPGGELSAPRS
jgi:membrane fusion protein (multidrug efflux system)